MIHNGRRNYLKIKFYNFSFFENKGVNFISISFLNKKKKVNHA